MRFWRRRRTPADDWLTMRYTASGIPRASTVDGVLDDGTLVLIKNVPFLRLTYQVRWSVWRAVDAGVSLEVHVPRGCRFSRDFHELLGQYGHVVQIVEVD